MILLVFLLWLFGLRIDYPKADQYGRPLIVPRGGKKAKSYTRPSTLAGILPGKDGLMNYHSYTAVGGTLFRPELRNLVGAYWPPTEENKGEINKLMAELRDAGGASLGAKNGTALHASTVNLDEGRPVVDYDPEITADLKAYQEFMKAAGLEIIPGLIECTIVLEKYGVAGSADRIVRKDGKLYIFDLKTGKHLGFGEWAVQLALYSRGESLYDWDTETHEDMPEVDQDSGLVLHLPFGKAKPTLYVVDLVKGWEAAQQAMAIHAWRKTQRELAREARV